MKYFAIFISVLSLKISETRLYNLFILKSQTSFSPTPSPLKQQLTRYPSFMHYSETRICSKHFFTPFPAMKMLISSGFFLKSKKRASMLSLSKFYILYLISSTGLENSVIFFTFGSSFTCSYFFSFSGYGAAFLFLISASANYLMICFSSSSDCSSVGTASTASYFSIISLSFSYYF